MVPRLQTTRLPRFHRSQTTPGSRQVSHAHLALPSMSPNVLRGRMLQLPLATTDPPHQVHLRHLQKVSRLLPRLRTRCQGHPSKSSCSRSQVRLGGMQHLRTRSPPRLAPMLHSTSARRRGQSQAETRVEGRSRNPTLSRTPGGRSRYTRLGGTRSSPSSLLRLRSPHRRRRQSNPHPALCRDR